MKKPVYIIVYTIPVVVMISFRLEGWLALLPILIYFGLVPLVELALQPIHNNLNITAERQNSRFFDWALYLAVPVQVTVLVYFLNMISVNSFEPIEYIGHVMSMGLMCGVLGINIAHELGHRVNRLEQFLAEILLLTSMEMHFLPYHNLGHHKHVATPGDPATARKNEPLFIFWFRSQIGSYFKAWEIEEHRLRGKNSAYSIGKNKVFVYTVIQYSLLYLVYFVFGLTSLFAFIGAAIIGILLLETVNYIEHYGLVRNQIKEGIFERVQVQHSWNSDHPLGRAVLFELSRHSDHHYKASKKYQTLISYPESPQMPTGYPGMMVMAMIPPIWFRVMNGKLRREGD